MKSHPSQLILVCGHAVFLNNGHDPATNHAWCLQPFQAGEPPFYLAHIRGGVELAAAEPEGMLVFSGGQTRREAGPVSEAESYRQVAENCSWWGHPKIAQRTVCEEFARDSFENLLFSICRFHEVTGTYPERISVVGWKFKEHRFDLHRAALRFPAERFSYVGVNNPLDLAGAVAGEQKNAVGPVLESPYGNDGVLAEKRAARNPFQREPAYAQSCPELANLLHWGEKTLFTGILPWAMD